MPESDKRQIAVLLLIYGIASLVHFIHNAEFIRDYPNLPQTWTRSGVYIAWMGMTAVGCVGWFLLARGYRRTGLLVVMAYAVFGLDSLGHYVLAPLAAHSMAMNATILLEVTAAAFVFMKAARTLTR